MTFGVGGETVANGDAIEPDVKTNVPSVIETGVDVEAHEVPGMAIDV